MFSGNDHAMAPLSRLAVWYFFQYAHGLITDEVVVNLLLSVKRDMEDGIWQAIGLANGSTWISAVRWGQTQV